MKLKLSNVDLNDNRIQELLLELLEKKEILTHLDLSWTKLKPNHLKAISLVLKKDGGYPIQNIRNLNLSYNSLIFDETAKDPLPSDQFIENLLEFIQTSRALNHLDISGMKLGRDYNPDTCNFGGDVERHTSTAAIVPLALACAESSYIAGVHMSDNGVRNDTELFLEILDIFGLSEKSLEGFEDHTFA